LTKVEKLSERLDVLNRQVETSNRRGPSPWFGFRSAYPVHSYDPPNARFDITNMNAWEWFAFLQWTATEIDEYIAISIWNAVNSYPLTNYDAARDLRAEAEALHKRRQELEVVAQGRAEELDRKAPDAWIRWKEFYKQLEQQNEAQDQEASDEPVDDSPGGDMRLLWDWRLQVLEAYRKCEKERSENGKVSK
jgi:hypothetical protein